MLKSLDAFYKMVTMENKKDASNQAKEDIFSLFESEFGRTLSNMEILYMLFIFNSLDAIFYIFNIFYITVFTSFYHFVIYNIS